MHTVTLRTTEEGIPSYGECSCSRWSWTRPADDRYAGTLLPAMRAHRGRASWSSARREKLDQGKNKRE